MAWSNSRTTELTTEQKNKIRSKYTNQCSMCGAYAIEVDHIIPLAEGGTHRQSNLQLLCEYHHRIKTLKEIARGKARRAARGCFNHGTHPFDA